jgi:hypothetical protein
VKKQNTLIAAFFLLLGLIAAPNLSAEENPVATQSPTMVASTMTIKLQGDLELSGTPIDLESVQVNSLFGEADLPLHTIAGVRFAQDANQQTTIVLQNGDVLTGDLTIENLKFVSDWGEATVHVGHIRSIVFRPDLTWSPVNSGNGTRWRLTKSNATTQAKSSHSTNSQTIRYFRPSGR